MVAPLLFTDRTDAQAWLDATFAAWLAALTQAEREALYAYKHTTYQEINHALRADLILQEGAETTIQHLDTALSRFRLPHAITTFRGVDLDGLRQAEVGMDLIDFGFVSCSLLRVVAEEFAGHGAQATIAQILIPGGTQVGAYAGAPDLVSPAGELEILLPRATRLRVLNHTPDTINLEVITHAQP